MNPDYYKTPTLRLKKPAMTPPSGWVFHCEDGTMVKGNNSIDLDAKVAQHFLANQMPVPENLPFIIRHQICMNNDESLCLGKSNKAPLPSHTKIWNMTRAMLDLFIKKKENTVSEEQADDRAILCVACPQNQETGGCWYCSGVKAMVQKVFLKKTKVDRHLFVCNVCGCVNAAQVHCSILFLSKVMHGKKAEDYPAMGCWKRKELEELESCQK